MQEGAEAEKRDEKRHRNEQGGRGIFCLFLRGGGTVWSTEGRVSEMEEKRQRERKRYGTKLPRRDSAAEGLADVWKGSRLLIEGGKSAFWIYRRTTFHR